MKDKINLFAIGAISFTITSVSTYEPISQFSGGSIGFLLNVLSFFGLVTALNVYFYDKRNVGQNEAAFFAALAGLLVEMHQFFLPFSAFSLIDVLAKSLGASTVLFTQELGIERKILQIEDQLIGNQQPNPR